MSEVRELLVQCGEPVRGAVLRAEKRLPGADPLVVELLDWAASMRVTRGLELNTVANYLDAVSEFMLWMIVAGKGLDAVTAQLADEWQRDLYVRLRQGARTRSLKLTALRQFFAWREERGLGANRVRGVRGPKKAKTLPKKYSHREQQAMLAACERTTLGGKRDYAILLTLISTGMRVSELAGLTLEQITLKQRVGHFQFTGKGAKERVVSFEGPLIRALLDWLEARAPVEPENPARVFCSFQHNNYGRPLGRQGVNQLLAEVKKRAKLECRVHAHKFRVTFATEMYDQGHELEEIRIVLGHESIETTRQYLAVSEKARRARLPARHLRVMTGEERAQPLWLAQRARERGDGQQE